IVFTTTLASVGTAGVPGTAMVMLTVTLNAVGLPLEGIAFIAAIDRVIDMARTTTNVTGDMAVAVVLGRQQQPVPESSRYISCHETRYNWCHRTDVSSCDSQCVKI